MDIGSSTQSVPNATVLDVHRTPHVPAVADHVAINYSRRIARNHNPDLARWLKDKNAVVMKLSGTGVIVMLSEEMPWELREPDKDKYPVSPNHPHSRDLFLFNDEIRKIKPKYAPFHHDEFAEYLYRFVTGHEILHSCVDVTPELQHLATANGQKIFEHVYRIGIRRSAVAILIYSSVDTRTCWAKGVGADRIRFVYEMPWQGQKWYQKQDGAVNRTGDPFLRMDAKLNSLTNPGHPNPLMHFHDSVHSIHTNAIDHESTSAHPTDPAAARHSGHATWSRTPIF